MEIPTPLSTCVSPFRPKTSKKSFLYFWVDWALTSRASLITKGKHSTTWFRGKFRSSHQRSPVLKFLTLFSFCFSFCALSLAANGNSSLRAKFVDGDRAPAKWIFLYSDRELKKVGLVESADSWINADFDKAFQIFVESQQHAGLQSLKPPTAPDLSDCLYE